MAYFITKAEVIAAAFSRDIEDDKIRDNQIEAAGIRYLLPILGEDFYDDVVANPGDYTTLEPYLIDVVAQYVKYEMLPELHKESSTAGLNNFTGQNKQSATRNDLEGVRQSVIELALSFGQRLLKFLEDNTDTYTLYVSAANPQNQVKIAGGIVFDEGKSSLTADDTYRLGYGY